MSTATHGYQNEKMFGKPRFTSVHQIGSSKTGQNSILKAVAEVTALPQAIVSVTQSKDGKELTIEITAHGAKVGDIFRLYSGVCNHIEYDIIEVPTANTFKIFNIAGSIPAAADTGKVLFFVTSKADAEGNVNFSPGPTTFIQDSLSVQVTEDTADAANNKPLPSGMFYKKDGEYVPVVRDTVTPSNNAPMPVEIIGLDGASINITAGDINVQLGHTGATYDSVRIGDGTELLAINADGSINIQAASLPLPTGAATEAKQDEQMDQLGAVIGSVGNVNGQTEAIIIGGRIRDYATIEAESEVDGIEGDVGRQAYSPWGASYVLDVYTHQQNAGTQSLLGIPASTAPATDTDSANLNGRLQRVAQNLTTLTDKLPSSLGQKTEADSLSVVFASGETVPVAISGVATEAKQDDEIILLNNINTAADEIVDKLPSSIGAKISADSLSITPATNASFPVTSATFATTAKQDISQATLEQLETLLGVISGKLPASLGAKLSAASLSVVMSSDSAAVPTTPSSLAGTITTAQKTVGVAAVRATVAGTAPSATRKKLILKPSATNSGKIYYGGAAVTIATGVEIIGPDTREFDLDAGDYYLISDTASQVVEILEKV